MVLHGLVAILSYFARGVFKLFYSTVHEVEESDIDTELATAWRETFNEEPPQV